ncbi:MAG: YCF48-related protein [Pirellula sp.]
MVSQMKCLRGVLCTLWAYGCLVCLVFADEPWHRADTGTGASLRGVASVDERTVWACGSKGTLVRTIDEGRSWSVAKITGLEDVEIRSIHAWSAEQAIVATAGQPAVMYKTKDGGLSWKKVYENLAKEAFVDGLRFSNDQVGYAFSDPVDGKLLILKSVDAGETWAAVAAHQIPEINPGEAGFAASNSSLAVHRHMVWIGLGGHNQGASRVFRSQDGGEHWRAVTVQPISSSASAGIFSIAFASSEHGVAVGGDYRQESIGVRNVAVSDDGGLNWREPRVSRPSGYRSCVVCVATNSVSSGHLWIACGPSGCDWSSDRERWLKVPGEGFHAMHLSKDGTVWASGSAGRVARLQLKQIAK